MGLNPNADPGDPTDDSAPPTDQQPPAGKPPLALESLHAELQTVRSEAAKYRTSNRDLRKLMAAMTGEEVPEGGHAPDLAHLQKRFDSQTSGAKAQIRELKVRNGLLAVSHKRGIDADFLEFSLSRAGQLADLDVDAEDFGDALDERVAEFLVSRPEVRGQQSGPPPPPGGTGAQFRPTDNISTSQLSRAAVNSMSPEEVAAALASGQLNALLGRKGGS